MQPESVKPEGGGEARPDPNSADGAVGGEIQSGSPDKSEAKKGRLRPVKDWAIRHKAEIILALGLAVIRLRSVKDWVIRHKTDLVLAFGLAVIAGVPIGWYFKDPPTYYVVVVEDGRDDLVTEKKIEDMEGSWDQTLGCRIHVRLRHVDITEDMPPIISDSDRGRQAEQWAEKLINDQDTLIVIGHLPSGPTEYSLPTYLGAPTRIPYISTGASDDDLLSQCQPQKKNCLRAAFIQPSPRNTDQAQSAVLYAMQKSKKKCVVVTDEYDPADDDLQKGYVYDAKTSYQHDLVQDYDEAARNTPLNAVDIVDHFKMQNSRREPKQVLAEHQPNCILYAGGKGSAKDLVDELQEMNVTDTLVILSDRVVFDAKRAPQVLKDDFGSVRFDLRFTYATHAKDYNDSSEDGYASDAVQIAGDLIDDLNSEGGDFQYKLRSAFHLENVVNARSNLIHVMQESAKSRRWYECETTSPDGICLFYQNKRSNGLFHVWQLGRENEPVVVDVDNWHPPKEFNEKRKKHRTRRAATPAVTFQMKH